MTQSPLRVAISGSTGLVGTALAASLQEKGHHVLRLRRSRENLGPDDIYWNPTPDRGEIDSARLEGVDAVVNLAGENIANRRWSQSRKNLLRESRIEGTRLLASALSGLKKKPEVFATASAVGYYGDRDEVMDERSEPGSGFLPELCRDWEDAARPASEAGIRVATLRIGVVLSPLGGALKKMLPPFLFCAGGPIGSGRQAMAWISIDDTVGAIEHVLTHEDVSGPVNLTAPVGVSNAEFARTFGRVLGRPAFMPLPAFVVRLIFGEMGDAILLGGAAVRPARLEESGYTFLHKELEPALRHVLGDG